MHSLWFWPSTRCSFFLSVKLFLCEPVQSSIRDAVEMGELSATSTTQTTPNSNESSVLNPFCSSLILKPARHWAYLNSTQLSSRPLGPWRGTAKVWLIFSLPGRSWRHWSETNRLLLSAPLTWTKTCWNSSTTGLMWVFNTSERLPTTEKGRISPF